MYSNPQALGRDLTYIIITCPLSDIYAWSLMSAIEVYSNPPALGRDLAHIITHPLSNIYVQSLMSATGHTSSEFNPGYPWPVQSTPHGLLSSQPSCQDPTFTVGLVILPGVHAWWHTIRVTGPNWEVGTTQ